MSATKNPPLRLPPDDAKLHAFAAGANAIIPPPPVVPEKKKAVKTAASPRRRKMSWDDPKIAGESKLINLTIPLEMHLKLKYLADYTPKSMSSFIREHIAVPLDKEIAAVRRKRQE